MATRFRLTSSTTAPAVSPAFNDGVAYAHENPTNPRRKLLTTDASALTTTAYTPDAADHLVAGDALHFQFVSDPMNSGIAFTSADVIKFAIQALEANAANNLQVRLFVKIVSEDGATLRRTLRPNVNEGTEVATALTNRFLSTTQSGATYTTVSGDRLVVEFSLQGTPTAAGGTQGHNGSLRWGGAGAGGDLPENDTDTGTTLNPWIEFIPTITFVAPANRIEVAWAELQVPTPNNRVEVSWSELELPFPSNRIEIAWAELQVPTPNNRVEISWSELEVPAVGGTPDNRVEISWTEVEVPFPSNRVEVSFAELEFPFPSGRIEVAWAEFEVPIPSGRVDISWAELEVAPVNARVDISWAELEVAAAGEGVPSDYQWAMDWITDESVCKDRGHNHYPHFQQRSNEDDRIFEPQRDGVA